MLTMPGKNFSYLVRLRIVTESDGQTVLRGSLQCIGSTQVHYFTALDDIARILHALLTTAQGEEDQQPE